MMPKLGAALLYCAIATQVLAAAAPSPPAPPCDASRGYVCGLQGPEDLLAVGSKWAVASAFSGNGLTMIRFDDRKPVKVYPAPTARDRLDAKTYPQCPGGPGAAFRTHGLYVAPGRGPVHKLFVVGHGGREAIEVFEVDTRPATPAVTWIGCAIAAEPIGLNSVVSLPDGGFITTNFLARGAPLQSLNGGAINGELWEWHARSGWQKVRGSEASGPNGVELSRNGRTLYIAAWGTQSLIRLSRGGKTPLRDEVPLGFRIDNIHWTRDGQLIGVGQDDTGWRIATIDPKTLRVTPVRTQKDEPAFGSGTVALEVGNTLWIGSYRGDRIAIVPGRSR